MQSLHMLDDLVFFPGVGNVSLGTAIRKIKDGSAPPSLHLDLFWDGEPSILTMADVNKLATTAEYARWESANPRH